MKYSAQIKVKFVIVFKKITGHVKTRNENDGSNSLCWFQIV
jgi:hypothetical protein